MRKKILASMLALSMIVGLAPMTSHAEDVSENTDTTEGGYTIEDTTEWDLRYGFARTNEVNNGGEKGEYSFTLPDDDAIRYDFYIDGNIYKYFKEADYDYNNPSSMDDADDVKGAVTLTLETVVNGKSIETLRVKKGYSDTSGSAHGQYLSLAPGSDVTVKWKLSGSSSKLVNWSFYFQESTAYDNYLTENNHDVEYENNDKKGKANELVLNTTMSGVVHYKDTDWFVFEAPSAGKYQISASYNENYSDGYTTGSKFNTVAYLKGKTMGSKYYNETNSGGDEFVSVFRNGTPVKLKAGQKVYIKVYRTLRDTAAYKIMAEKVGN